MQTWKLPHLVKGILTQLPVLNDWRRHNAGCGGTSNSRYCYSVWLRHLVSLSRYGFRIGGATVGELGPGNSIGVGLAALLSGAERYVGLDVVPFATKVDLEPIFEELLQMYSRKEPIPDESEFPGVRPKLTSYAFPMDLVDCAQIGRKAERIRTTIQLGFSRSDIISYRAPWTSMNEIAPGSLDLLFSQAVLQYVTGNTQAAIDNKLSLEETYRAIGLWLKPRGLTSHAIDLSAGYLSPFWNGHWAYSDTEWRIVRGRREFFISREPLSAHLESIRRAGLDVTFMSPQYGDDALAPTALAPRYLGLDPTDLRVRGVFLILRQKASAPGLVRSA